ncbi:hypothetical protein ACFWTE_28685 [Nocardiopsis sp. NPDC058631]|uniref:hypothetical protein n=1 Tax=Nocardiopsis sp. NPDC058631 TaxID=3346566 RepID=UPI0036487AB2
MEAMNRVPRSTLSGLRELLSAALLASCVLAACAAVAPEAAADVSPPRTVEEITDLSRVERVAAELEQSPLYVHHGTVGHWSEEDLHRIGSRLGSPPLAEHPVQVVVYPSVSADETGGQPSLFLHALHEVSGRDGVYVALTVDSRIVVEAFGSALRPPEVDPGVLDPSEGLVGRADQVLDRLEDAPTGSAEPTGVAPDPDAVTAWAPMEFVTRPEASDREPASAPDGLSSLLQGFLVPWFFPYGVVAGVVTASVFAGLRGAAGSEHHGARRTGGRDRASARTLGRLAPSRPRRWFVRLLLARELRVLRLRVERLPSGHAGADGARQAYDAAGLISRSPGMPVTALVCAVVLVRYGEQILDDPGSPLCAPCEANALHGAATGRRLAGRGADHRSWRLCSRCSVAADRGEGYPAGFGAAGPLGGPCRADDFWTRTAYTPEKAFERVRSRLGV